jgi:hypothetical protein
VVGPTHAISHLEKLLVARTRRWSRSTLPDLYALEEGFAQPGDELTEHLVRNRRELASWIGAALETRIEDTGGGSPFVQRPGESLRRGLVRWMHRRNQFLSVDGAEATAELDDLYRTSLLGTARLLSSSASDARVEAGMRDVFAAHQVAIASFVRPRLGDRPQETVCAEYSPALQLRVLGLRTGALSEPILDVGCGASARLVRHLRDEGYDAVGLDRDAPQDVAVTADWLDFPFGGGRWGTVVSHLGFSLHFLHHHRGTGLTADALALAHARAYMRILRSLRTGGHFTYAPALPFIEALLPSSEYRVERIVLPPRLMATAASLAATDKDRLDLAEATRVTRLTPLLRGS